MVSSITTALAVIILAFATYLLKRSNKTVIPPGTRSPPGPAGKPIIGSMLDIPPVHSWFKFKELTDQYGPITKITIAGQDHVLLGTEQVANDLLRERGSIYSDRPTFHAANIMTRGLIPLLLRYGDVWRTQRSFFHHVMSTKAAAGYASELEIEATRMARDLIRDPSDYENFFERYSGGIILRLAFGVRIESGRDPRCQSSLKAVHDLERVASPAQYLVDLLPAMKFLPEFLAPWKTELKKLRNDHETFFRSMLDGAKRDKSGGKGIKSWANVWLSNTGQWSLDDLTAAHMFGGLLEAGSGTSGSTLMSFCLLMTRTGQLGILQQELDRVVGAGRVPTIADLPQLPTVRAFAKEVLRFYPVTAGGAPHMLTKDDVYKGFFFKAGTFFHANQWAIHRDPEQYPDPESFNPQRWLDPKYPTYREPLTQYPNLVNYTCFGSGRRICPGQHVAELSVFLGIAMIAWVCNISKAKDDAGQDITPPFYDFNIGFNVQPNKFPFKLEPRSKQRIDVLERAYENSLEADPLLVQ